MLIASVMQTTFLEASGRSCRRTPARQTTVPPRQQPLARRNPLWTPDVLDVRAAQNAILFTGVSMLFGAVSMSRRRCFVPIALLVRGRVRHPGRGLGRD